MLAGDNVHFVDKTLCNLAIDCPRHVYAELDINNQLPKNITNGKVPLHLPKGIYKYVGVYPILEVSAGLKELKITFRLQGTCEVQYVTPCTTDICNIN